MSGVLYLSHSNKFFSVDSPVCWSDFIVEEIQYQLTRCSFYLYLAQYTLCLVHFLVPTWNETTVHAAMEETSWAQQRKACNVGLKVVRAVISIKDGVNEVFLCVTAYMFWWTNISLQFYLHSSRLTEPDLHIVVEQWRAQTMAAHTCTLVCLHSLVHKQAAQQR